MNNLEAKVLRRQQARAVGTNAGASGTITGAAGEVLSCVGIQCSGDAACLITIQSPAGTNKYSKRFAGAFTMSERFGVGEMLGTAGANMIVNISASTSNCEVNIQAASLPA